MLVGEGTEVYGPPPHFGSRKPRKIQQSIDKCRHALRFGTNPVEILDPLFPDDLTHLVAERLAPAIDTTQGGAQIVRYRVSEGFQFLVGCFQPDGAVAD